MKENSIEEDMKILEGIIKGDEACINAIYSQMKVKNDNDEDIQYYKKEIQSIKNIVDNYLKEKARADKLEKEYSAMLTKLDENECDYKRVLKENEKYKKAIDVVNKEKEDWIRAYQEEKDKQFGFINKMSSKNLILKQEIKNKIKELNKYYKKEIYPELYSWSDLTITEHYDEMIELLQELLKGSEE